MALILLSNLLIGIFLIWSGYFISNKKNYHLIAGYNDMNIDQRKRVNITRLSKALKIALYFMGISIAIIPTLLFIRGTSNWGISYPLIIIPATLYYMLISFSSIRWKVKGS